MSTIRWARRILGDRSCSAVEWRVCMKVRAEVRIPRSRARLLSTPYRVFISVRLCRFGVEANKVFRLQGRRTVAGFHVIAVPEQIPLGVARNIGPLIEPCKAAIPKIANIPRTLRSMVLSPVPDKRRLLAEAK